MGKGKNWIVKDSSVEIFKKLIALKLTSGIVVWVFIVGIIYSGSQIGDVGLLVHNSESFTKVIYGLVKYLVKAALIKNKTQQKQNS